MTPGDAAAEADVTGEPMTAGRPWWKRRRPLSCGLSVLVLLLLAGASVRHERREYRDVAGNVTAVRSAVLLPWQRLPPIADDRSGSVGSRARLAYGLVTWTGGESRKASGVGGPP